MERKSQMSNNAFASKFMRRMFRRIGGVVWDLTSGATGLKTDDGIHTVTFNEDGSASPNVNPFNELGMDLPAFAMLTQLSEINKGDIVVGANTILGWAVEAPGTGASIKVIDHQGHHKTITPPKVSVMNQTGILVVKNLFSLTGGADGAAGLANNMLPLIMMMGDGADSKLEKLFPLMLMQSAGAGAGGVAGGMNPMMLMMLMKDGGLGGGKIDPMMLMAMSGGFGGGAAGGMNPMMMLALSSGLGGSDDTAPAPTTKVRSYGLPIQSVPVIIDEHPL